MSDRLGQLQRLLDETVRRSVERVTTHPTFQKEMRRIERSIQALEARISRLRPGNDGNTPDDDSPPR